MALFSIFKTSKNQRFEYKPRYWDPIKEEKEERLRYLKSLEEDKNNPEAMKNRIAGSFRRSFATDNNVRTQQVRRTNRMLLYIIVVLVLLSYLFITFYLPGLMEQLE